MKAIAEGASDKAKATSVIAGVTLGITSVPLITSAAPYMITIVKNTATTNF